MIGYFFIGNRKRLWGRVEQFTLVKNIVAWGRLDVARHAGDIYKHEPEQFE
jgi:hypothetical protein